MHYVNVEELARMVFDQHGSWWQPGPMTWVYAPRHQAFWQHVLDIEDTDDDYDVWAAVASRPEMVAARSAPTKAQAVLRVKRLLVEWATPPAPVTPGEVEVVWDDSDDVPSGRKPPPPTDLAARLAADEEVRAERFAREWEAR